MAVMSIMAVITAACSSLPEQTSPDEAAEPVVLDDTESEFLFRAEQRLIAVCMRDRGFDQWTEAPPVAAIPKEPWDARAYDRWAWDDPVRAAETGYGIPRSVEFDRRLLDQGTTEEFAAFERWLNTRSPEEQQQILEALEGTARVVEIRGVDGSTWSMSEAGCRGQAVEELYGSVEEYLQLEAYRARVGDGGRSEVDEDPDYLAVERRWAACMAERGFEVSDPGEAYSLAFSTYERDPASEFAVAVADAECNREVGLRAAGDEALARVRQRLAEELGPATGQIRRIVANAVARAISLLEE